MSVQPPQHHHSLLPSAKWQQKLSLYLCSNDVSSFYAFLLPQKPKALSSVRSRYTTHRFCEPYLRSCLLVQRTPSFSRQQRKEWHHEPAEQYSCAVRQNHPGTNGNGNQAKKGLGGMDTLCCSSSSEENKRKGMDKYYFKFSSSALST